MGSNPASSRPCRGSRDRSPDRPVPQFPVLETGRVPPLAAACRAWGARGVPRPRAPAWGGGLAAAVAAPPVQRQNLKIANASQTEQGEWTLRPHPREAQGFLGVGVRPPGGSAIGGCGGLAAQVRAESRGAAAERGVGEDGARGTAFLEEGTAQAKTWRRMGHPRAKRGQLGGRPVGPCRVLNGRLLGGPGRSSAGPVMGRGLQLSLGVEGRKGDPMPPPNPNPHHFSPLGPPPPVVSLIPILL